MACFFCAFLIMIDTYQTIEKPSQGVFKEKGSKFLAYAYPVSNEEEIKQIIKNICEKFFDARHHCYAWSLGADRTSYRINDDGEPSGTAGRPIFGQIQSNNLTNILIVVVRYFGGTLLGVSGLINAYKNAAADALVNASVITCTVNDMYSLKFNYPAMNGVMKILKDENIEQSGQDFDIDCSLIISIRKANVDKVLQKLTKISSVSTNYLKTI
jgi:uncharacterized YigZ family protein